MTTAAPLPIRVFTLPARGTRVALHAATDEWMQGDRYGTIIGFTGLRACREYGKPATYRAQLVRVQLDSGRVRVFHPTNVFWV